MHHIISGAHALGLEDTQAYTVSLNVLLDASHPLGLDADMYVTFGAFSHQNRHGSCVSVRAVPHSAAVAIMYGGSLLYMPTLYTICRVALDHCCEYLLYI